jgi:hypothetical protein
MNQRIKIIACTLLLLVGVLAGAAQLFAQSVPSVSRPVCAYCGASLPNGVHSPSCPYYAGAKKPAASQPSSHSHGPSLKAVVAGALFESLLTSVFADSSADEEETLAAQQKAAALAAEQAAQASAQAAEAQRIKEAIAQAEYEKMMQSYKPLDGSPGAAFKALSDSNLAMKTLATNARAPFDPASLMAPPVPAAAGGATPFFGDTMPVGDIQLLVNPENDPRVVDLRNAAAFVAANLKKDREPLVPGAKPPGKKGNGEPIVQPPDCARLSQKLSGLVHQRTQFAKTVNMAQEQLATWENANQNALLNAAKDGLEFFTGQLLDGLAKRGEAAARLERIYRKNAGRMAQEGVDVAQLEAKIKRLRALSSAGQVSELTNGIRDWQGFIKDGLSSLMAQLSSSNQEIKDLLEDPGMQKYFETEAPELNALLDLAKIAASNKVFGKWVARKIPIIAGVEISLKESYNAFDWYLSFQQVTEANGINGRVLDAARGLQKNIEDTALSLRACPP